MEANTLRIGNLISKNDKPIYVDLGVLQKIQNGSVIYKPIPLSEEWFLKFDFELRYFNNDKNRPLWWLVIDNRHIDIYPNGDKGFYFLINSIQMSIPIIYVHQIQNLVYSLTGEELTIKE